MSMNTTVLGIIVKGAKGGSIFKFRVGTLPTKTGVKVAFASIRLTEFCQTKDEVLVYLRKKGADPVSIGVPKCEYGNFQIQLKPVESGATLAGKVEEILAYWDAVDANREAEYLAAIGQMDAHDAASEGKKKGKKSQAEVTV